MHFAVSLTLLQLSACTESFIIIVFQIAANHLMSFNFFLPPLRQQAANYCLASCSCALYPPSHLYKYDNLVGFMKQEMLNLMRQMHKMLPLQHSSNKKWLFTPFMEKLWINFEISLGKVQFWEKIYHRIKSAGRLAELFTLTKKRSSKPLDIWLVNALVKKLNRNEPLCIKQPGV